MEAALGAVGELLAADDQSAALVIVGGVRSALLALKLFAAVDRGPRSVHMQDLLALRPTSLELKDAAT